jgi:hypothetical protein
MCQSGWIDKALSRPFVFAGKAHSADAQGKPLIKADQFRKGFEKEQSDSMTKTYTEEM